MKKGVEVCNQSQNEGSPMPNMEAVKTPMPTPQYRGVDLAAFFIPCTLYLDFLVLIGNAVGRATIQ